MPRRDRVPTVDGVVTASIPVFAGIASTAIFASSTVPMLAKAYRTRDLSSYSLGYLVLANVGNAVHTFYVLALPPGPIWALHGFYVTSSALMLGWFLQARRQARCHAAVPADVT